VSERLGGGSLTFARDEEALADRAADLFVDRGKQAVSSRGMFCVALSGGTTPRGLYRKLAAEPIASQVHWSQVQVFFSDERFVPPDSNESNYRMAKEALLSKVPIPDRNVHRVETINTLPEESAGLYEQGIRRVFKTGQADVPRFDLILLGLGDDGHTASLFPGTNALSESGRLVVANFVKALDSWRITFTLPLINAARNVVFLVKGQDKAVILQRVLSGDARLPATLVRPSHGDLGWLVDESAGAKVAEAEGALDFSGTSEQHA
jgi:6-phosphogluconolactonase